MCRKCYRKHRLDEQAPSQSLEKQAGKEGSPSPTAVAAASASSATTKATKLGDGGELRATFVANDRKGAEIRSNGTTCNGEDPQKKTGSASTCRLKRSAPSPSEETPSEPPRKVQKNTNRCFSCRRKIGLTGFRCRCLFYFCSEHLFSDKHDCDFDYKSLNKAILSKENPTVRASKVEKI